MRMWMIDPRTMCREHLLGEHCELHMFVGSIKKRKRLEGFFLHNCLEPSSLEKRHAELVAEMTRRNYHHRSPLGKLTRNDMLFLKDRYFYKIDRKRSHNDLLKRCAECRHLTASLGRTKLGKGRHAQP